MIAQVQHPTRWRFSVREYYQMAEVGILGPDVRVELIDGEVIQMPPIGGPHGGHVNRLTRLLVLRFNEVALVTVQNPVRLDDYSEPQPDLALVRHRSDDYTAAHPTPAEVFVVIEVSDTTAAYDRRVKGPLYARSGIPEYWRVDLQQQTITIGTDPTPEGYRSVRTLRRGDRFAPLAFPDREIAVTEILGEA